MLEGMRSKQARQKADQARADLVKLSSPAFLELVRVAEAVGELGIKAAEKLELFDESYPFFAYERSTTSPVFGLLAAAMRFLSGVAQDPELLRVKINLEQWSGKGPSRYRRVLTGGGWVMQADPEPIDHQNANRAFRAMLPGMLAESRVVIKPIDKYIRACRELETKTNTFLAGYAGQPIGRGYDTSLLGEASLLVRIMAGFPGGLELVRSEKGIDAGYFLRCGLPPIPAMDPLLKRETLPLITRLRAVEAKLDKLG